MNCNSCGKDLPDDAKFCMDCGTRVSACCFSCRTEMPPEAKFCMKCGKQAIREVNAPSNDGERLSRNNTDIGIYKGDFVKEVYALCGYNVEAWGSDLPKFKTRDISIVPEVYKLFQSFAGRYKNYSNGYYNENIDDIESWYNNNNSLLKKLLEANPIDKENLNKSIEELIRATCWDMSDAPKAIEYAVHGIENGEMSISEFVLMMRNEEVITPFSNKINYLIQSIKWE